MNQSQKKAISEAQKKQYARKRQLIVTYGTALAKISRMPTAGIRAKNVAVKALNGNTRGEIA